MRVLIFAAMALHLSACATAPPPAVAPQTSVQSSPAGSSRAMQLLAAAGQRDAPSRADIERAFGRADIARQDGAGAALTYRTENCGLLLLFEADQHNVLRLEHAHTSARRSGEPAPGMEQCAREAAARR